MRFKVNPILAGILTMTALYSVNLRVMGASNLPITVSTVFTPFERGAEAMFGEEALHDVLRRNRHLPAVAIKDAILAAVNEQTAGVVQSDDITLVVIRRQG